MKWLNEGKPIQLGILSFARRVSIVNGIIESANGNRAIYPITIGESLQTLVEREQNSFFYLEKGIGRRERARERGDEDTLRPRRRAPIVCQRICQHKPLD